MLVSHICPSPKNSGGSCGCIWEDRFLQAQRHIVQAADFTHQIISERDEAFDLLRVIASREGLTQAEHALFDALIRRAAIV